MGVTFSLTHSVRGSESHNDDTMDSRSDWDVRKERPPPSFTEEAHRISFQSRHTLRSVWPIHDLLLNDLFVWLLPTHFVTHLVKNIVILLIYVVGMIAIQRRSRMNEAMNAMAIVSDWELQHPWHWSLILFPILWTLLFGLWLVYNRRILCYIVWHGTLPWYMHPSVTSHRRCPMRSHLCRFATEEATARRNAVRPELHCSTVKKKNEEIADNVFSLDALTNWRFRLFATPEEALQAMGTTMSVDKEEDAWAAVRVPSHWTLPPPSSQSITASSVHDTPIYTNIQYPFRPIAPPLVPSDHNPTGMYHVALTWPWLDDGDGADEFSLLLHGIESACYVFWNESYIGFTKDSRLLGEFRIPYCDAKRENTLLLVVVKWCDGTYVEDQDHWYLSGTCYPFAHVFRIALLTLHDGVVALTLSLSFSLTGIHRSVEIVRRPSGADLVDFQIQADANGHFECCVEYRRRTSWGSAMKTAKEIAGDASPEEARHSIDRATPISRMIVTRIYNDQQLSASGDVWESGECIWERQLWIDDDRTDEKVCNNGATGKINIADTLSGIQPWSAELPSLYTLTISMYYVVDDTGKEDEKSWICRQSESCRIGFRTIDIVAPGVVTINGRPARAFAGINRHEHDPDYGKVVSLDRMQQDLCLLKYVL
jgi:Glycosyl hydrolases family 2, sugar binding domain/Glycosyl hydrolases family 2, TIM barrel domain